MGSPYVGQIKRVGCNFAPVGWEFCNGQLLLINDNAALFSLLGTTYGGDGVTTFALPDLRGRHAIGAQGGAQGPGLQSVNLGEMGGSETATLNSTHLPAHNHSLQVQNGPSDTAAPASAALGLMLEADGTPARAYSTSTPNDQLSTSALGITPAAGSQSVNIRQPYLGTNFIISLFGVFPSAN